ncbi:PHB/PHA accumulation regulator DNA-binding domain protein [Rhodobacteraceae bacterium THAF1]|uniref:polyhydroxyalkanoate synthesis repressor PhaR n=1 Tax=Palleronia sp. THAF1 TaxID=2587842 RepID=UPI000F4005AD|nr:polyhydroxyalkanoate synthesis repressor PhaR [Palleronia sp. THAF1]QFU09395.1 PHB/PHA accumulation regulator DNA-binding domain protein [Palleronia sp. THAF1]VDC21995.1 PHB/PHA accumulation regulator DNA-binding domain protein [Rhodobacteraceae bacterium THAF1]
MADTIKPLLIKRYASRRLYNTETSDYVTLDDISGFIRDGREVQIVDLKSGDDLTRQYLLQIVAENESKGQSVLPLDVLTDLVRSYTTQANSVVPEFLKMSFDMLRQSQQKMMTPMTVVPGFEVMQKQQEAFLKAMTGGGWSVGTDTSDEPEPKADAPKADTTEMDEIRKQLKQMQDALNKLNG